MNGSAQKKRLQKYKKQLEKSSLLYVDDYQENVLEVINTYVVCPVIALYVLWVLTEAVKHRQKRLYFMARDGYLMYQAAVYYCEKYHLDIECRYIYCSRYALRVPMYHLDMKAALDYICSGGVDVTPAKIMKRADLTEHESKQVLAEVFQECGEHEILPYSELKRVKEKLMHCGSFLLYMKRHSEKKYPLLKGYLEQNGLLEDEPVAIVDSGWTGSIQRTLNLVLKKMGRKQSLEGYYFGLYELPSDVRRSDYHSFYFSPESGYWEKVFFSNCFYEAIISAPYGMTTGYTKRDDRYLPICGRISTYNRRILLKERQCLREYLDKSSMGFSENMLLVIDFKKEKKIIGHNMSLLMSYPTKKEVDIYGKMNFTDDIRESEDCLLARKMNEAELNDNHFSNKILMLCGIKKGSVCESAWYEGSAARDSRLRARHWASYIIYKCLLYIKKKIIWSIQYVRQ